MDPSQVEALQTVTTYFQSEGPEVLRATLKGVAGAVGGALVTKGILPGLRKSLKSTEEPIKGLYPALAMGIGRALVTAVEDENGGAVEDEAWSRYMRTDWLEEFDKLLMRPLTDTKAWDAYAESLTSPDSGEGHDKLVATLQDLGMDLEELGTQLSLDIDGFLYWLGPSLVREIEVQAIRESASFGAAANLLALSSLRTHADSESSVGLSPAGLRRNLRSFLEAVERSCERRLRNDYLPEEADPARLQRTARIRVAVRTDSLLTNGVAERYVPISAQSRFDDARVLPWDKVVSDRKNMVILADPGLGKTRLLHIHARELAKLALQQLERRTMPNQIVLPILVRCDQLHSHVGTLEEACVDILVGQKNECAPFAKWLLGHLENFDNTYLLDALDEVPEHSASLPLGNKLVFWSDQGGIGQVIISSRIAGYERPQGPHLTELELQPFTPEEVKKYVHASGLDTRSRSRVLEQLDSPSFMGMARIPLLLNFICCVAGRPGSLPTSRRELYDRMLDELLRDRHRLGERDAFTAVRRLDEADKDELRRILPLIALHFSETPRGWVDRMPLPELQDVVSGSNPKVPDILNKCLHSGILTRAGVEELSNRPPFFFLHRTFAEYFVAAATASDPDLCSSMVSRHIWFDPDWDQVLPLVGSMLRNPLPYLKQLIDIRPDPLHRGLRMAARVVAELSDEQADRVQCEIDEIASRLLEIWAFEDDEVTPDLTLIARRLPKGVVDALVQQAKKEEVTTEWLNATDILIHCPGLDVTHALLAGLDFRDYFLKTMLILSLRERPGREVTDALLEVAGKDQDPSHRAQAMLILGERPEAIDARSLLDIICSDSDRFVREIGVSTLWEQPHDSVTKVVVAACANENVNLRIAAVTALGASKSGEAVMDLLKACSDEDERVRAAAVVALHGGGDSVTEALLVACTDRAKLVRAAAVKSLGRRHRDDISDVLIALLNTDDEHEVRSAAAAALRFRDEREAIDALIAACEDPHAGVRTSAVKALRGSVDDEIANALVTVLDRERENHELRVAVVETVAERQEAHVTKTLVNVLGEDRNPEARKVAAKAIANHLGVAVLEALITALLNDENHEVRCQVAKVLGDRVDEEVKDALLAALRSDENHEVRRQAADVLSDRIDEQIEEALIAALQSDEDAKVRQNAADALSERVDIKVSEALITALQSDESVPVRLAALKSLGRRNGTFVARALTSALMDCSADVSTAAASALPPNTARDVIPLLSSLIADCHDATTGACNLEQALKIYSTIRPILNALMHYEEGERRDLLRLGGTITDIVTYGVDYTIVPESSG